MSYLGNVGSGKLLTSVYLIYGFHEKDTEDLFELIWRFSGFLENPLLFLKNSCVNVTISEIKSRSSISSLKATFSGVISLSNTLDCVLNS